MKRAIALVLWTLLVAGCATAPPAPAPETRVVTVAPAMTPEVQKKREDELAQARRDYEANPNSADAIIWLGRRTAYLGRYQEAIEIFTEGIRKHPKDARMYRHRGHRFITVRRFTDAVNDLEYAAKLVRGKPDEIEPDGQPNARNTPIGSLHTNIDYHLGLAYYLSGENEKALTAYQRCMTLSNNPDRVVSTSYWLYLTLRRLGRRAEAEKVLDPISTSMDIIENTAYHKLLLMFNGDIAPEELLRQDLNTTDGATILYGVGEWYAVNGEPERARPIFQQVVSGNQWSSFGYIAAEVELKRFNV
jgi:tetratricopeptide (TPR) repeat protein